MNELILKLARDVIESRLSNRRVAPIEEVSKKFPQFLQIQATFVTLKIDGKLRGCIGSLIAYKNLYDDLVSNSISAAFNDPRFKPLTFDELENLEIEVSLLSQPKIINYKNIEDLKSKVIVGTDGIILKKENKQATFLPQVWDELSDFDSFFSHLCLKAGLESNALESYPQIYKYQVDKIK